MLYDRVRFVSRDPNKPNKLPDGVSWPQFDTTSYQVLQLDDKVESITLPDLERVQKMKSIVMAAAKRFTERQKLDSTSTSTSEYVMGIRCVYNSLHECQNYYFDKKQLCQPVCHYTNVFSLFIYYCV